MARWVPLVLSVVPTVALGHAAAAQLSTQQLARLEPAPNDLALADEFGAAIALSGTTVAVGAPLHDAAGGQAGAVYVFAPSGSTWGQQAKLVALATDDGDRFGQAVGLDGDTLAVGAPLDEDGAIAAAGSVTVFVRQAGVWSEAARLVAGDAATFDHVGTSVALDGDTLVAGAEFADVGAETFAGAAYVFTQSGGVWSEQQKLVASDAEAQAYLGRSIAVSGDLLAVGAPGDDAGFQDAGAIYVFERSGTTWTEIEKLVAGDGQGGDALGSSVGLDATTLIAGAPFVGSNAGAAYVFTDGPTGWTQQAKLVEDGPVFADRFGASVAIDGDRAVVGLPISSVGQLGTGAIELFVRSGTQWTSQTQMIGSDSDANDFLGSAAALDGDRVAAGAPGAETDPSGDATGEAYLFTIVTPPLVETYCTPKTNSQGCVPVVSWSGVPSTTNPSPFTIECRDVLAFKSGLLFYGLAPAALPFQDGTLCVTPPLRRTPIQFSFGTPPPPENCTGTYAFDMNAWIQSGADPLLDAGVDVYGQYWSRDPGAAVQTGLSGGLHFVIDP